MKGKKSTCVRYCELEPIWLGNDNWENTFDKAIFELLLLESMKTDMWRYKKGRTAHIEISTKFAVPEEHAEGSQAWALRTEKTMK